MDSCTDMTSSAPRDRTGADCLSQGARGVPDAVTLNPWGRFPTCLEPGTMETCPTGEIPAHAFVSIALPGQSPVPRRHPGPLASGARHGRGTATRSPRALSEG